MRQNRPKVRDRHTKALQPVEVEGGAGAELVLHVESAAMEQGLATMGEGGYASHSVDFEREAVGSVLLGGGFDLVRVGTPVTVLP